MGIDVKRPAVQLARTSVQNLIKSDPDFAVRAAPMRFHTQNVFIPSLRHKACALLHSNSTLLQCKRSKGMQSALLCAAKLLLLRAL